MSAEVENDRSGTWAMLRKEFPAGQVGKLPRGGTTLDYVGHGAVTDRLLEADPEWNWEPLALDEAGLPLFVVDGQGRPIGLWIRLTVAGVTRLGFGNCKAGQFDAEKVLIGDAIRNGAMRFGVALDLWIRGHAEDDEQRAATDDREAPTRGRSGPPRTCSLCGEPLGDAPLVKAGGKFAHKACTEPAEATA